MTATIRGRVSRARSIVAVAGLVMILSGCGLVGSEGQSKESADAALSAIPGVGEATVTTESMKSGFQTETSTVVELNLEAGATVSDPEIFVDYLLRVAWSTQTKEANRAVVVQIMSEPQISTRDALDAGGWESARGRSSVPHRSLVRAYEVKERFGDWPGKVPELPESLIIGPTSKPTS